MKPDLEALHTATRVGLLGDLHGNMTHLITAAATLKRRGITVLLQVGDFGFLWPGKNWSNGLDTISRRLRGNGQVLLFVDGNHEDFDALHSFPVADDGIRWLRPNIGHLPRGYRATLASGLTLAALGGAASIDKHQRIEGETIWPAELISTDDLKALGHDPVDILIGHDAPAPLPALDRTLRDNGGQWPDEAHVYAELGRLMFTRGFLQVKPRAYIGGHFHTFLHTRSRFGGPDEPFETRVTLLDRDGTDTLSVGILDVHTLRTEFFTARGKTLTLTGDESGTWQVHTGDSAYSFDLDHGTVERLPGPAAASFATDEPRPIGSIERCSVGQRGYWTLGSPDALTGYERQYSSIIQRIERVPDVPGQ